MDPIFETALQLSSDYPDDMVPMSITKNTNVEPINQFPLQHASYNTTHLECCALREVKPYRPTDLTISTPVHRQLLFSLWVAAVRTYDDEVLHIEKLICPLLSCRRPFKTTKLLLKHIPICKKLVRGEYWCSKCSISECFALASPSQSTGPNSTFRFPICVKRAMSIVRNLGQKGDSSALDASDVESEITNSTPSSMISSPVQPYQGSSWLDPPSSPTLLNLPPYLEPTQNAPRIKEYNVEGWEHERLTIFKENYLNGRASLSDITPESFPPYDSIQNPESWLNFLTPPSPDIAELGTGDENTVIRPRSNDTRSSFAFSQASTQVPQGGHDATVEPTMLDQRPLIDSFYHNSGLFHRQSIENLLRHDKLNNLIKCFLGKIPDEGDIPDHGWTVLQNVISGNPPTSAMEVYCVLNVAYAAALAVYEKRGSEIITDLLEEVSCWSHILPSEKEKSLMIEVAQHMWQSRRENLESPQVDPIGQAYSNSEMMESGFQSRVDEPEDSHRMMIDDTIDKIQDTLTWVCESGEPEYPVDALKKGKVFQICMNFLDFIEYGSLQLATTCHQTVTGEEHFPVRSTHFEMVDSAFVRAQITQPLLLQPGLEAFHKVIINSERLVDRGQLNDLRKLELGLIHSGRVFTLSQSQYRSFRKRVHLVCEKARVIKGWITSHDIQHYESISETRFLLSTYSKGKSSQIEMTNGDPMGLTMTLESQTTAPSTDHFGFTPVASASPHRGFSMTSSSSYATNRCGRTPLTISTSPTTTIYTPPSTAGFTSPSTAGYTPASTNSSPSTSFAHARPSPLSPRAANRATSPTDCPLCGQPFTGTSAVSNLKRHMKNTHGERHGERNKFFCSFGSCAQSFTRPDNLMAHRRKIHHIDY